MEMLNELIRGYPLNDPYKAAVAFCRNNGIKMMNDETGNIIIKIGQNEDKRILVPVLLSADRAVVTSVKDKNATILYSGKESRVKGNKILYGGRLIGRAESKSEKNEDYLEIPENFTLKKGDILDIERSIKYKGNKLYGNFLSDVIQLITVLFCVSRCKDSVNEIYFTISFSPHSLKSFARRIAPGFIMTICGAKAADNFGFCDGCGVIYKDGNYVASPKIKAYAESCSNGVLHKPYFEKISTFREELSIAVLGADVAGLCVPIKYKDGVNEVAEINNISQAAEIMANMLDDQNIVRLL